MSLKSTFICKTQKIQWKKSAGISISLCKPWIYWYRTVFWAILKSLAYICVRKHPKYDITVSLSTVLPHLSMAILYFLISYQKGQHRPVKLRRTYRFPVYRARACAWVPAFKYSIHIKGEPRIFDWIECSSSLLKYCVNDIAAGFTSKPLGLFCTLPIVGEIFSLSENKKKKLLWKPIW